MRSQARISIVIPVFNGSRTLRQTLETARRQRDGVEIIVVDDASTEDIAPLVHEMGAIHHRLPINFGPATARTEGARVASGEIVLFTDSDVWLPDQLLSALQKVFAERKCECVQGVFSKQCPHTDFFSQYKNLYNRFVLNRLPDWIETTYTSLTAVDKDFFFRCGGFDQNIRSASIEDRTLGENIIRAGGKIFLDRTLEVVHNKRLSASGFFRSQFKRSRDLAKLLLRQRESGYRKAGGTFGTNTREAMLRLPVAQCVLISVALSLWSGWFLSLGLLFGILYVRLTREWIGYLAREKGPAFGLLGLGVDFLDALVSGLGVAAGIFGYKVLGKRY
ncbi:MAG: glycosyltransferase [Candidatus Omnitrophica bacterium]|nr:glycosyltransferase [Candidatus Omnitrophota bacterium]